MKNQRYTHQVDAFSVGSHTVIVWEQFANRKISYVLHYIGRGLGLSFVEEYTKQESALRRMEMLKRQIENNERIRKLTRVHKVGLDYFGFDNVGDFLYYALEKADRKTVYAMHNFITETTGEDLCVQLITYEIKRHFNIASVKPFTNGDLINAKA